MGKATLKSLRKQLRQLGRGSSYQRSLRLHELLAALREVDDELARTFCLETLRRDDVGSELPTALGAELERRELSDAAGALSELAAKGGASLRALGLYADALAALRDGSPCVCEVYRRRCADRPGPLLEVVREERQDAQWRTTRHLRCTLCARRLRLSVQLGDHCADAVTWEVD